MEEINNLLDLSQTISKEIFKDCNFVWEVLPKIKQFIIELGNKLNTDKFEKIGEDIWVAKTATVAKTACINGPCIIDEGAEIRHCAYLRGNVIIGKKCVVGNSTEIKNSILFNQSLAPHFNYVGDSILGYKAHMGAGAIASNVKADKKLVIVNYKDKKIETNLRKLGAILGDNVEVGCGSVLNPGTIIGRNTNIYPLSSVRNFVKEKSIYKSKNEIVEKYI